MKTIEMSASHNWCDRRCERCPLRQACPVGTSRLSMEEALEQAVTMAEEVCREEGIDTSALAPPPGPMALALQRAGLEWARGYAAIVGWDATALVMVGKLARIASDEAMGEDVCAADLTPNVLLVERLLTEARARIESRRALAPPEALAMLAEADRILGALLAPFSAAIPASDRLAIDALAASGRAPSPFSLMAT